MVGCLDPPCKVRNIAETAVPAPGRSNIEANGGVLWPSPSFLQPCACKLVPSRSHSSGEPKPNSASRWHAPSAGWRMRRPRKSGNRKSAPRTRAGPWPKPIESARPGNTTRNSWRKSGRAPSHPFRHHRRLRSRRPGPSQAPAAAPPVASSPPHWHSLERQCGLALMIGASLGAIFVLARLVRE